MISDYLFTPRDYKSIELFKNTTEQEWFDPNWQLKNSIKDVETLSRVISLNEHQKKSIRDTLNEMKKQGKEPMRITPYYASLMPDNPFFPEYSDGSAPKNMVDPVFWQSVPTPAHLLFPDAGVEQSMAESERSYGAFYQRYPNRGALFVCENTSCATFCTHCQRTKSLDKTSSITSTDIDKALYYLSKNSNINEVLVTGGDALRTSRERLEYVISELCKIPNIHCIRIATRLPVVLPMAVTDDFLNKVDNIVNASLNGKRKNIYFMTHVNHFNEITEDFVKCVAKIKNHGYILRNQTVFLNHVNADFYTLAETFRRMWWAGVEPYYLLQCHNEKGLAHFIAPVHLGKFLTRHLHGWISGTCRPTYSANLEGGGGKVTLTPSGYDIFDEVKESEKKSSKMAVTVHTWDDKIIKGYEALGRATKEEYVKSRNIMDKFLGRPSIFKPAVIIVDNEGTPIRTTRRRLPVLTNELKADLLNYNKEEDGMPITNPTAIKDELNEGFKNSKFYKR